MLTALVVDDELNSRQTITYMLGHYCPNVRVVGEADGVDSAYTSIQRLNPDVVFLDLQLADGNGFDLLRRFEEVHFMLIIVTAYQDYAIRAFKYCALDYLLKPIDVNSLVDAVDRLQRTFSSQEANRKFQVLLSNTSTSNTKCKKLVLKSLEETRVVETDDIVRCESHNNSTEFILTSESGVMVSKTLKEYEELLATEGFIRCHQSHLINKRHVEKVLRFPSPAIRMDNGDEVPVSVRKMDILKAIAGKSNK
jgi:two-component system LytT family response regulator